MINSILFQKFFRKFETKNLTKKRIANQNREFTTKYVRAKYLITELVSLFEKWNVPRLTDLVLETILFLLDTKPTERVREIILNKQRLKNEVVNDGIYT